MQCTYLAHTYASTTSGHMETEVSFSLTYSHIRSSFFFVCVCVHWQLLFMDGLSETCDLLCSPMSGFSSDKLSLAKQFVLETHPQGKEYHIFKLMHSNQKKKSVSQNKHAIF